MGTTANFCFSRFASFGKGRKIDAKTPQIDAEINESQNENLANQWQNGIKSEEAKKSYEEKVSEKFLRKKDVEWLGRKELALLPITDFWGWLGKKT